MAVVGVNRSAGLDDRFRHILQHEWGTDWIGSVSLGAARERRRPWSDPEAGRGISSA